jgi:HEAT repeat protein
MKLRRVLWVLAGLLVLAGLALLIPASPAYFPTLMEKYMGYQNGHTSFYWRSKLKDPDPAMRTQAVSALGAIRPESGEEALTMAEILEKDPDPRVRVQAAFALTKMRAAAKPAVPALAKALKDEDQQVRLNAALTLGEMGKEAHDAVPALREALKDDKNKKMVFVYQYETPELVALALGRATAGTDEAVPDLLEALDRAAPKAGQGADGKEENPEELVSWKMRKSIARALGEVGPAAKAAVPKLRELEKDPSEDVRDSAKDALEKIEGKSAEAKAAPAGEKAATP